MAVHLYVATPFRKHTGNQSRVALEASTVRQALAAVARDYPGLAQAVMGDDGVLPHINVFVNDEEIRHLQGMDTPLRDGDELALIPSMAGGRVDSPTEAGGTSVPTGESGAGEPFTDEEIVRYSRHILLPEVGGEGQLKLRASQALLIGAGGLGSPAALYLAAAGVGTIGVVDFDRVDLSNLQRQVLHHVHDIGRPKVESAAAAIADINPHVRVIAHPEALSSENALRIIQPYDVVLNGCDNFPTRYLLNDACVFLRKPLVDGSVFRFEGQATVYLPGQGCYRCAFPAPPPPGTVPSCAEAGVLGALPGLVGMIQAIEAVKVLLGIGESLAGHILHVDALSMHFRKLRLRRNPACPVCGDHPTITELIDYHEFCGVRRPVLA